MRLTRLETFTTPFVGFVKATAEDGSFGWGQVSTYHADITAEVFHRQIAPHAANLGMVTICTMHLLKALPNAGKYLELSIEGPDYYPWQEGLFLGDPCRVEDGHVTVPDAPGWGVEVNPDWLSRARWRESVV